VTTTSRRRSHANQIRKWPELGTIDGNVLLIVNSRHDQQDDIARSIDALLMVAASDAIHVIAGRDHEAALAARGIPRERILFAESDGGAIELNHFLESSGALAWIGTRQFHAIVGSAPHNLHNDEIKSIFEERVALFIGDGVFLAHALPEPYVYVFDGIGLVSRFGRGRKVDAYRTRVRALIGDLQQHWEAEGRPAVSDAASYSIEMRILEKHLGRELLEFDETSPVPPIADGGDDGVAVQVSAYLAHLFESLRERDRRTDAITEELRRTLKQLPLWRRFLSRVFDRS
jgi:hypothetical protein